MGSTATVKEHGKPSPRPRRRAGEVQALILEAARRTFAEKGYARTTTREIAARAAVAEPLLFRNFGSKAKLFAAAVLHPMVQFFRDVTREMSESRPLASPEKAQRRFVEGLYTIATEQRGLLLTLFATSVFEPAVVDAAGAIRSIQNALDELAHFTENALCDLGLDPKSFDVPIASRSVIGMVLAMALFGDWLLPVGRRRPSREHLLDELTRQTLYGGMNQRPDVAKRGRGGRGAR